MMTVSRYCHHTVTSVALCCLPGRTVTDQPGPGPTLLESPWGRSLGPPVRQGLAAEHLIAGAGVKPFVLWACESDADTAFSGRFGNDSAETASGIEHLDASMAGDI